MQLDLVHDIQAVYRKTVDSMARPGLITNIHEQAAKLSLSTGAFNSSLILALMLFDTETKFKVYSLQETEITKWINQLTYAKAVEPEEADYILVTSQVDAQEFAEALERAYPGDLLNPHRSATVIVEADSLSNERDLTLSGPGIAAERPVQVKRSGAWVDIRAQKNSEYPMGIDLIFVDPADNILCLPRTTIITR